MFALGLLLRVALGGALGLTIGVAIGTSLDQVSRSTPSPAIDRSKFTHRGEEAERSAYLTGDGVYSYGEFAGGEVPKKD